MGARILGAIGALTILGAPALAAETGPSALPLAVSLAYPPTPVSIDGARRLIFELDLANWGRSDLILDQVTIRAGPAILVEDKGAALDGLLTRPGPKDASTQARQIGAGRIGVLYFEATLPASASTPPRIAWDVRASPAKTSDATTPLAMVGPVTGEGAVSATPPVAIGFPLPAGRWVAANGPSNASGHRRTVLVVDGRPRVAQRFAIDWLKLGPDGLPYHGDKSVNANWYGFGEPVLAVADATVAATHDGVPENEPADKRAVPITLETVAGNYVMLDLGGGRYALYAHLQPGSQKVKAGDTVRAGQTLALLGNTGNSDAPHLHFHIADAPSPLGSEGLPYVFARFATAGTADLDAVMDKGARVPMDAAPVVRHDEIPAENAVVIIP